MRRSKYGSSTSFIDLLFNLLLVFVSLFILSFILINPVVENDGIIIPNAEFLITVTWPGDLHDDIDLWAEDPQGNVVYFNRKEAGLMHLDRDDVGDYGDEITNENGEIVRVEQNQEIITIRGYISGEYVVNIFMYSKFSKEVPVPVTVQILKINPFQVVHEETIVLSKNGEERTISRFTLDSGGLVIHKNTLQKPLTRRWR
jgi:hypothetical protein